MKNYTFTCSCGEKMTFQGNTHEEALEKAKAMMTPEMVTQHMTDKHQGQEVPPYEAVMAQLEAGLVEEVAETPAA